MQYSRALKLFIVAITALLFQISSGWAHDDYQHKGYFKVINSGGFRETKGIRMPLDTDYGIGTFGLSMSADKHELMLEKPPTRLQLFHLKHGLASIDWEVEGKNSLDREDIQALVGELDLSAIQAWAARIDWPNIGPASMIIYMASSGTYNGFLISHIKTGITVRQIHLKPVPQEIETAPFSFPGQRESFTIHRR